MSNSIVVEMRDVKPIANIAFPDYSGRKARIDIRESYSYNTSDLNWSGGSKTSVVALKWNGTSFNKVELPPIFFLSKDSYSGDIPLDGMLVEHVQFCGTDLGLRFVVHPQSIFLARFLPNKPAISDDERFVLQTHKSLKASYRNDEYARKYGRNWPIIVQKVKEKLIAQGLLKANSAGFTQITIKGENAL